MQDEYRDRPLQPNDLVRLHTEHLKALKKKEPKRHQEIVSLLDGLEAINDAYVILEQEKAKQVFLVGRSSSSGEYARTNKPFPVEYLFYVEPEGEDGFTSSERKSYGLD